MLHRIATLVFAWVSIVLSPVATSAEAPTTESLIAAWEQFQSRDPHVRQFKKTGDRHYLYETDLFPYKGELIVLNAVVDPNRTGDYSPHPYQYGTVEVRLVGLTPQQELQLATSLAIWRRSNTLYFDAEAGRWISQADYTHEIQERYGRGPMAHPMLTAMWLNFGPFGALMIGLIVFLVIWSIYVTRIQRRYREAVARNQQAIHASLQHEARIIELLEKLVDMLEKRST